MTYLKCILRQQPGDGNSFSSSNAGWQQGLTRPAGRGTSSHKWCNGNNAGCSQESSGSVSTSHGGLCTSIGFFSVYHLYRTDSFYELSSHKLLTHKDQPNCTGLLHGGPEDGNGQHFAAVEDEEALEERQEPPLGVESAPSAARQQGILLQLCLQGDQLRLQFRGDCTGQQA